MYKVDLKGNEYRMNKAPFRRNYRSEFYHPTFLQYRLKLILIDLIEFSTVSAYRQYFSHVTAAPISYK